jgi:medium-chain acyl-[acyl-carrier-protein] hydrolase
MTKWLWLPQPRPAARLRLYCLAHAGAGASTFSNWGSAAPPDIEIAAIKLPGRESRLNEEPLTRLPAIAQLVSEAILSADNRPFALFGHSAGGKFAIHVAAHLEDTGHCPLHAFISGAPVTLKNDSAIHNLDHDEFIQAVAKRFGPLPMQITDDSEIWRIFERPLRGDMEALETDELSPRPLNTPLTIISGARDNVIDKGNLALWQAWSRCKVHYEVVDADHFSYRTDTRVYLSTIAKWLFAKEH